MFDGKSCDIECDHHDGESGASGVGNNYGLLQSLLPGDTGNVYGNGGEWRDNAGISMESELSECRRQQSGIHLYSHERGCGDLYPDIR